MTDKNNIKTHLSEYCEAVLTKSKGNFYCCPLCGSGSSGKINSDGAFSINPNGTNWHCFACDCGGDLIDLISIIENIDTKEAFKKALELYGDNSLPNDKKLKKTSNFESFSKEKDNDNSFVADFSEFIKECKANINKIDYPNKRGLSNEIIEKYNLGYYDGTGQAHEIIIKILEKDIIAPSLIMPYNSKGTYFIARSLFDNDLERAENYKKNKLGKPNYYGKIKHDKPCSDKAGAEPIYNKAALYNKNKKPVFITESPLDCLSCIESGVEAIAIGGTGHIKLIKQLEKKPTACNLIIALDNDVPGQKATAKLKQQLEEIGYKAFNLYEVIK